MDYSSFYFNCDIKFQQCNDAITLGLNCELFVCLVFVALIQI